MSQLFASGGQSIGVSASTSVLPMVGDKTSLKKFKRIGIISNALFLLLLFLITMVLKKRAITGENARKAQTHRE